MVKCALPAGHSIVKQDQYGNSYTFPGAIGVAPGWENGSCSDLDCQGYMTACLMAHVNSTGFHVPLWLDGNAANVGWGQNPTYPKQEGTFFGNIFVNPPEGYYCEGEGFSSNGVGVVAGRINGGDSTIYRNPFGYGVMCKNTSGAVPVYSTGNSVPDGFSQITYNHAWAHPITVWRGTTYSPQFSPDYRYRFYALLTRDNPLLLDIAGANSSPGTRVDQWPLSANGDGSYFKVLAGASGTWTFRPAWDTSKCVDSGAGAEGSAPTIQVCNGGTTQQFTVTPNGGYGTVYIQNVSSGRCMDTGSSAGSSANLSTCDHVSWQEYRVLGGY